MDKGFLLKDKHKCPTCGAILNAGFPMSATGSFPKANDVTICGYCSSILQYNPDLSYREADLEALKKESKNTYDEIMDAVVLVKSTLKLDKITDTDENSLNDNTLLDSFSIN